MKIKYNWNVAVFTCTLKKTEETDIVKELD